jgi:hypothetical protein
VFGEQDNASLQMSWVSHLIDMVQITERQMEENSLETSKISTISTLRYTQKTTLQTVMGNDRPCT